MNTFLMFLLTIKVTRDIAKTIIMQKHNKLEKLNELRLQMEIQTNNNRNFTELLWQIQNLGKQLKQCDHSEKFLKAGRYTYKNKFYIPTIVFFVVLFD